MPNVVILRRGELVSELVSGSDHPLPLPSSLVPGMRFTIVTRDRVLAWGGTLHRLELTEDFSVPVLVKHCAIGPAGWVVDVEVMTPTSAPAITEWTTD